MTAGSGSGPDKNVVIIALLLLLATLAVYWQVPRLDFLTYDDNGYVTANAIVRNGVTSEGFAWAFSTFHEANWHPLTWLSHMADCQVYGLDPRGHHLTNLLFHLANVLILFLFLGRLGLTLRERGGIALLFAIHPLHVESVAWVAERKDLLAAFFFLSALFAYVSGRRGKVRLYLLVLPLFACGLLAKPMVVTLPCVLLLLDWWPLGRFRADGAGGLILEKIPFFLLSVASSIVTIAAQRQWDAVPNLTEIPLAARLANLPMAYVRYLGKMIWPADLAVFYPYEPLPWWEWTGALLLLAGVTALVIVCRRRAPWYLFGWLWYLGMLVPVIGVVQVGEQAMADRYSYLPLVGISLMAVPAARGAWSRWRIPPIAGGVAAALLFLALGLVSYRQTGYWRDSMALFTRAAGVTDGNYVALTNLGTLHADKGESGRGDDFYREALRFNPRYAPAHYNLGVSLTDRGDLGAAELAFRTAVGLKPAFAEAHYNLGVILARQERYGEAAEQFAVTLRLDPAHAAARHNRELAERRAAEVGRR